MLDVSGINQCETDVNCPTNAVCLNTDGSYECRCKDNYNLQNGRCTCEFCPLSFYSKLLHIVHKECAHPSVAYYNEVR